MIIIGDIHGRFDLLMRLISILPHTNLCFVGDLIDRGPYSRQVVQYVIDNNHICVMGNHEDFMVASYDKEGNVLEYIHDIWDGNGARATLMSYMVDGRIDDDTFHAHREWMSKLPIIYKVTDNIIISHSYCLPYINMDIKHPDVRESILWDRSVTKHNTKDILNIHGHSIITREPKIVNGYLNIDTGAYSFGILTAYDTDTGKIYSISDEDTGVGF